MSYFRALLFDVGNSRLKWGVYEHRRICRSGSITHAKLHDSGFAALTTRLPKRVDTVLASNVAGASFATRLSGLISLHCDTDVHFAHTEKEAYGLLNSYRQPRRMGVDRWVAMIGAHAELRSAFCVVDAGTALTIDAVDRAGRHIGGQILPGLNLMARALRSDTSDIPAARQIPKIASSGMEIFAGNTDAAISNGVFSAVCGAIERAVRTLRAAGYRPKIVLTGGDASRILKQLDGSVLHRPHLVLQGLAHMVESDS
jgi:type III pantothenate kinase